MATDTQAVPVTVEVVGQGAGPQQPGVVPPSQTPTGLTPVGPGVPGSTAGDPGIPLVSTPAAPGPGGPLAHTGFGLLAVLLLAAVLLAAGALALRRSRSHVATITLGSSS